MPESGEDLPKIAQNVTIRFKPACGEVSGFRSFERQNLLDTSGSKAISGLLVH